MFEKLRRRCGPAVTTISPPPSADRDPEDDDSGEGKGGRLGRDAFRYAVTHEKHTKRGL